MIYGILILVCIFILCGISIWMALKFLKNKKMIAEKERRIPEDILKDFEYAEQQMKGGIKEDGTTTSPYKVLWKLARERREEPVRDTPRTEQQITDRELHTKLNGGQSIQSGTITEPSKDKQFVRKSKPNSIRQLVSRVRRK